MGQDQIDKRFASIGSKLRQLRINAGYSAYADFAYGNDLSPRHYWRLESGRSNISLEFLMKVLDAHELSLEDFFKDL